MGVQIGTVIHLTDTASHSGDWSLQMRGVQTDGSTEASTVSSAEPLAEVTLGRATAQSKTNALGRQGSWARALRSLAVSIQKSAGTVFRQAGAPKSTGENCLGRRHITLTD
jgi:hypothetical protein